MPSLVDAKSKVEAWKFDVSRALAGAQFVHAYRASGGQILCGDWAEIRRRPLLAFTRGDLKLPSKPAVAIVGARGCSTRGRNLAEKIAHDLARAGTTIISGAAVGIDAAAHRGALTGGGRTIAVLGAPAQLEDERPSSVCALFQKEPVRTLSITPFGPWVKPGPFLFPRRNELIASLADAVIVVEGGSDSGSLITARLAQQMDIPVYAVPGDVDNPQAAGPNLLLAQGAKAWLPGMMLPAFHPASKDLASPQQNETAARIVVENASTATSASPHGFAEDRNATELHPLSQWLLHAGPARFDDVVRHMQKPAQEVALVLSLLEIEGEVQRGADGCFSVA